MKQVVLSLSEESDERLRRLALTTRSGKKGALSQTVEEALALLEKKLKQKHSLRRLAELANADSKLGVNQFARDDAYR